MIFIFSQLPLYSLAAMRPYNSLPDEVHCNDMLCRDALALLKEQEAPKTTLRQHGGTIEIITEPVVKHGRWELVDEQEPRRYGCSECKRLSWDVSKYCPSCGARMDGGGE